MKTADEYFNELLLDKQFKTWYAGEAKRIKEMVRKYPFQIYWITEDAPYALTCPGSKVYLFSYCKSGEVRVALMPQDFLPATIEHIRIICQENKKDFDKVVKQGLTAVIDPKYLEPTECEEKDLCRWIN